VQRKEEIVIQLPILNSGESYKVDPSKIIALGLNYRTHVAESKLVNVRGFDPEIPEEPILFAKTPNVLIGAEESIIIPKFIEEYAFDTPRTDYEAELAFIVKDRCKNVPQEQAFDHIFGYTCMNDVSMRNFQTGDKSGWFRGKSLDTFGPIGPHIVRSADIGDAQSLHICCRVNGRTVQDASTADLIFTIPEIVSFITKNFTLLPGDIVMTGTPGGVGPLHHGDVVEVEIENIGILRNSVIEEGK
jgi:2-keto-4-pentenoate hydratase/2-oxohepta-3-ene-1,7-dioic acid hydratase in catechol pathway